MKPMIRPATIIYVDDEAHSLKYFALNYQEEFKIVLAANAEEGWREMERLGSEVAVFMSDQRMPGMSGVELLNKVRLNHPKVVRILTTAYADLSSAIAAINEGAVYRYVQKPWNFDDLRATLRQCLDYRRLISERDALLREKLGIVQRLMVTNRVHSLSLLAAALSPSLRHSLDAVAAYLVGIPMDVLEQRSLPTSATEANAHLNLGKTILLENRRLESQIRQIANTTLVPSHLFDHGHEVKAILAPAIKRMENSGRSCAVQIPENLIRMNADVPMLSSCFSHLMDALLYLSQPQSAIQVDVRGETSAHNVHVTFRVNEPKWSANQLSRLYAWFSGGTDAGPGISLLSAYFIIHHHSGSLQILNQEGEMQGFEVCLPVNPSAVARVDTREDLLETLFARFEDWDAAQLII